MRTHKRQKPRRFYVSLYSVSRHYGGPEEGGWWYDVWRLVRTYPRRVSQVRTSTVGEKMRGLWGWRSRFGRSSMAGGADAEIVVENFPGEVITRHRPHYE